MLPFLAVSGFLNSTESLSNVKERGFVVLLGEPSNNQLLTALTKDISGEKVIVSPHSTYAEMENFHLKIFKKGSLKIGGISLLSHQTREIQTFLYTHKDIDILLLDANPKLYKDVWNYINTHMPKYVFYNHKEHVVTTVKQTKVIGVSTLAVERYKS